MRAGNEPNYYKVVARGACGMPHAGRRERNFGNVPFDLPACSGQILRRRKPTERWGAKTDLRIRLVASRLKFLCFFDEREQPLCANAQIDSRFGVFHLFGMFHPALEIRNLTAGKGQG